MPRTTDPEEALAILRAGNRRFVSGRSRSATFADRIQSLAHGQRPFAIILGCSDSRVPAEIVFDQGIGDLFVIRIAGNIVAPSQIGSIEFAASSFGTSLVVVLGHTGCGAIEATLDAMADPDSEISPGIRSIVDRIRPALEPLKPTPENRAGITREAVRANVRASVDHLSKGSEILSGLLGAGSLMIVPAEYDLSTGEVAFLDD